MRKLLASVAMAAALVVPQVLRADDAAPEKPNTGALSLSGGVDFVTSYVFRGYEYVDTGLIVQPYAQLNVAAYTSDNFSITPYVGIWSSIQDDNSPGGSWYEEDVYGGVDFAAGNLTIGLVYTYYTYPNNALEDIQEFGVKLSYNDEKDAESMGLPFQLKPYVAWYIETSDGNTADTGLQYAEVGINPTVAPKDWPVSFNFPIAIGMSPDGYYFESDGSNETFGFISAGAFATYALPVDAKFGSWSLYAGATYYYLNADNLQDNEDSDYEIVGKAGIAFAY